MWWSHADAGTYRAWIREAGLEVTSQRFVPEGDGGHALFWARRGYRETGGQRRGNSATRQDIS